MSASSADAGHSRLMRGRSSVPPPDRDVSGADLYLRAHAPGTPEEQKCDTRYTGASLPESDDWIEQLKRNLDGVR
jgi:hypothetical protein